MSQLETYKRGHAGFSRRGEGVLGGASVASWVPLGLVVGCYAFPQTFPSTDRGPLAGFRRTQRGVVVDHAPAVVGHGRDILD